MYYYVSNDSDTLGAEENSSKRTSFTKLQLTSKRNRITIGVMKPNVKNRGVVLNKVLSVDNKDLKNTDNTRISKNSDETNHGKKKAFLRKFVKKD